MRMIYMGSPEFAVPPLLTLYREGYDIVAVYCQPDKPAGRGRQMQACPVKRTAASLGIRVAQPLSLKKTPESMVELTRFKPDIIVVAAFGQILPREVLALPRWGCLNLHPSLLPRHRGAAPVMATLLAGDCWAGTSIMLMDDGVDTGPVLVRASIRVREEDTTGTLAQKLSRISASLLIDVIPRWLRGQVAPQPQDESRASYFKPILKDAGRIDWNLDATDILRRIRAFQPWPGAFTTYRGKVLKITSARVRETAFAHPAGTIVALGDGFGVITGNGTLEVVRLQLEGKKELPATDFLRGQPHLIDTCLPD